MANFINIINAGQPVLVDFYADWCDPCKTMTPIINEVEQKVQGKAKVIKVNVDNNQQTAINYQRKGIPTFVLYKKGKLLWRQSGVSI